MLRKLNSRLSGSVLKNIIESNHPTISSLFPKFRACSLSLWKNWNFVDTFCGKYRPYP